MRRAKLLQLAFLVAVLAALAVALRDPRVPLGVRGEWEWLRVSLPTNFTFVLFAAIAILAHAGFSWLGARDLSRIEPRKSRCFRESAWLFGLLLSAIGTPTLILSAAPDGHGLDKWAIALHNPGSSGYYLVAKKNIRDPRAFLANYGDWIKSKDSLHIGTHPAGLLMISYGAQRLAEENPGLRNFLVEHMPASTSAAFRALNDAPGLRPEELIDPVEQAALTLIGGLTLLLCSATVIPLYLAARSSGSAFEAWASATVWPLVPAAILFQPIADAAFPVLTMTAIALATRSRSLFAPMACGVVLAIGMQLTLAFLPCGLIVALVLATAPETSKPKRLALVAATGVGFLAATLAFWAYSRANPFLIWAENLKHHAHFYVEFPRTYRKWLLVAPIETAIAIGLPASWAIARAVVFRKAPRVFWVSFAVILLLHLSGRNLGEAARLWLPLFPPLLIAISAGLDRRAPKAGDLFALIVLMGAQVLIMQSLIQVVYPDWEGLKHP